MAVSHPSEFGVDGTSSSQMISKQTHTDTYTHINEEANNDKAGTWIFLILTISFEGTKSDTEMVSLFSLLGIWL